MSTVQISIGLLVTFWTVFAPDARAAGKLAIVKEGKANAVIVTAAKPSENARIAARELQVYLEKISDVKLELTTDELEAKTVGKTRLPRILVGRSSFAESMKGLEIPSGVTNNLNEEGFVIYCDASHLVLAGNDTLPYYGTRYAVYELLYRFGVRWFLPGEFGEVVPRLRTLEVSQGSEVQRPDFPVRTFWTHSKDRKMNLDRELWKVRNKLNPRSSTWLGMPGDSSIIRYMPKNRVKDHPEWFALGKDGKRNPYMPCMTDDLRRQDPQYKGKERLLDVLAETVKKEARAGKRSSAMAPQDGVPRCFCKLCSQMNSGQDVGYGASQGVPSFDLSISQEWFYFIDRLMDEVGKEFPNHLLATNGYSNRFIPPKVGPEFNRRKALVLMFADIGACTIHRYDDPKCWQMVQQGEYLKQWARLCDKVWIYNYNYTMLVGKSTIVPTVHRIRRNIPLAREYGIFGFSDQDDADMSQTGIPTYVIRAALEWNTGADVDTLLDDFFTKWYGLAAESMKEFYAALEKAFDRATCHGHEDPILPVIYTAELMAGLGRSIASAEKATKSEVEKLHVRADRLIYDHLNDYVAMERAKQECQYAQAAKRLEHMLALKRELHAITPYFGWHPYPVYQEAWELNRMKRLMEKVSGPEGKMIAPMPLETRFLTDPANEGEAKGWMAPELDDTAWKMIRTSTGWQNQGLMDALGKPLCDAAGRAYRGAAWYRFNNVTLPDAAANTWLFCPAVVNEVWVWVNGQVAGHMGYMQPWFRPHELDLDISKFIRAGKNNQVTLRVVCNDDNFGANGIYERLFLYSKRKSPP